MVGLPEPYLGGSANAALHKENKEKMKMKLDTIMTMEVENLDLSFMRMTPRIALCSRRNQLSDPQAKN